MHPIHAGVRFSAPRPFLSRMRDFLLGVLGAGLTYVLVWYQVTPAADVVPAPTSPRHVAAASAPKVRSAKAPSQERRPPEGHVRSESTIVGDRALLPAPSGPEPAANEVFIEPLPTALPKTIERMAELQRLSADPNLLASRVQTMETDEADLAELKAFAERFVEIPPDRVQRHVPRTSR